MSKIVDPYLLVSKQLIVTLDRFSETVPKPRTVATATGRDFRYREKLPEQALVLKAARMLSALVSLRTLLDHGLYLDAGAMFRILDEVGIDIRFIAAPKIFNIPPEQRHQNYLAQFFQEEFDSPDPISSTQKRHTVSRAKIIAYVARTYHPEADVQKVSDNFNTIEKTFSGFIHGAAVHTMDTFDGVRFCIQILPSHHPLASMEDQFSHYLQRTLMSFAIVARALGDQRQFELLVQLDSKLFDRYGEFLPET